MMRTDTWHADLAAYIQSVAHKPFVWGQHDCTLFAAGAVHAMTGEDLGAPYRGKYKTLRGALGILKRGGFASPADIAASMFEEIHPSQAAVGDVAAIQSEDEALTALGIVQGERVYVVRPGSDGIGTVDLLSAKRAFRV